MCFRDVPKIFNLQDSLITLWGRGLRGRENMICLSLVGVMVEMYYKMGIIMMTQYSFGLGLSHLIVLNAQVIV